MEKIKFSKNTKKDFDFKIACLGSVGLTFISDIDYFKKYLEEVNELRLLRIIENNMSLTEKELEESFLTKKQMDEINKKRLEGTMVSSGYL